MSERLRVVHVIDGLGTGGAERSLSEMLPALRDGGIRSSVICLERRAEGVEERVRAAGFPIRFLSSGHWLTTLNRRLPALKRLLAQAQPDILHTTHFASDLLGRLAGAGMPVAVMSSLVNRRYAEARRGDPGISRARLELVRRLDGWTARRFTDHLHAVSRSVKDEAIEKLGVPAERITIVPRGRDPVRFAFDRGAARQHIRGELGLGDEVPVLVNVGRREYQKGQEVLLSALARLRAAGTAAVLLIVGREGRSARALEHQQERHGLGDAVRFLGHRGDVPELLAAADLFVFPSLFEGSPGALIEAMAMELPVVASRVEAVEEIVDDGDSAILVAPQAVDEWTGAVQALLTDRSRAVALGRRGGEIFAARFTLAPVVDAMIELYRRVACRWRAANVPR